MIDRWIIYGANGYTGRLLATRAAALGLQPILAGRNAQSLEELGRELGCEVRVFELADPRAIRRALAGVQTVVHCAGPYAETAAPVVDAALATSTHYLDLSGEIDVLEAIHARHEDAVRAGVVLLPGMGVAVPSDCLAAALAQRVAGAASLELAFAGIHRSSVGTARTTLNGLIAGKGYVRRGGRLVTTREGRYCRQVPFDSQTRHATSVSWGDVTIAARSTGIGDVTAYMAMPCIGALSLALAPALAAVMRWRPIYALLERLLARFSSGPSARERELDALEYWAEVRAANGARGAGSVRAPNVYDLTVEAVMAAVRRLSEQEVSAGAHTPASAFGAGFAATLPGVTVRIAV